MHPITEHSNFPKRVKSDTPCGWTWLQMANPADAAIDRGGFKILPEVLALCAEVPR
jgi:hypothetical protein